MPEESTNRLDALPRTEWEEAPPERIVKTLFAPHVAFAFLAWVAAYHPELLGIAVSLKRMIM